MKINFLFLALYVCVLFSCSGVKPKVTMVWDDFTIEIGKEIPGEVFNENTWMPLYTDGEENWFSLCSDKHLADGSGISIYLVEFFF